MDSTKSSASEPPVPKKRTPGVPKKRGNPNWVKGYKAPDRPYGSLGKFSAWKLSQLLDIWGPDVAKLARLMMKNALDAKHPKQEIWAKYVIERTFPASKAIEITGLGGRAIEMQVLVNGIKEFENTTLIEGTSEPVQS